MAETHPHLAHLLLAAGASTRMGRPKQLLTWQGKSLIQHAVAQIQLAAVAQKIVVVLGANQELIAPELSGLQVEHIINPDWQEGMGSSIRCGVGYLVSPGAAAWQGICISLVDQPLVQAPQLRALYEHWQTQQQPISAASYDGVLGAPALFGAAYFPALLALGGATGARQLLQQHRGVVAPVAMPEARFDLDTPEDYRQWK